MRRRLPLRALCLRSMRQLCKGSLLNSIVWQMESASKIAALTDRMRDRQDRWRRVRDCLLDVGIASSILGLAAAFAIRQAMTGGSPELPLQWIAFGGVTAVTFGYAIHARRRSWSKPAFWLLLAAFFIVHASLGVFALTRVGKAPLIVFPNTGLL